MGRNANMLTPGNEVGRNDELRRCAEMFAETAERELANGDLSGLAAEPLQRALTAAVKLYVAKGEAEGRFSAPVSKDITTPTEIVTVVSEMLRAIDLNLFDLEMWFRRDSGEGRAHG